VITRADVEEAAARIAPILRPTPLRSSDSLSRLIGRPVRLKPEHEQRTGSFKIRGAYNRISRLDRGTPVVAASAGNHAQGVALAAARGGCPATVFMPASVALPKLEATSAYGATVELVDGGVADAIAAARAAPGTFVPPFDDPFVAAGQGTVGWEVGREAPDADVIVVPVGGGGLVGGIGAALAGSGTKVIGVQVEAAASMVASRRAGRPVTMDPGPTICDGVAISSPSELTLALVDRYVADIVTVTEEEVSRALLLLLERAKAVVEPAGALGLAALLADKVPGGGPAVVVLSGGNVDPLLLGKLIDHGLAATGRYVALDVILDDQPGALARLTGAIADLGLNVLDVVHHREASGLAINQVKVALTLETRDPGHQAEVLEALRSRGFEVVDGGSR
jgi:threonine dehydratase